MSWKIYSFAVLQLRECGVFSCVFLCCAVLCCVVLCSVVFCGVVCVCVPACARACACVRVFVCMCLCGICLGAQACFRLWVSVFVFSIKTLSC